MKPVGLDGMKPVSVGFQVAWRTVCEVQLTTWPQVGWVTGWLEGARAYEVGGAIAIEVALLRLADIIEHRIALEPAYDEVFLESLRGSGEIDCLGMSIDVLSGTWLKLVQARGELLTR